jgi:spore photoproduct lyase
VSSPSNYSARLDSLNRDPGFLALSEENREYLLGSCRQYMFTHQEIKRLIDIAADLEMWGEASLERVWDRAGMEPVGKLAGKQLRSRLLSRLTANYEELRRGPKSYEGFIPPSLSEISLRSIPVDAPHRGAILGRCPVASDKTRCCNLETLDAVIQCGYGCSYCSIQSFYDEGRIYFADNLEEKLSELEKSLVPGEVRHIGTGQSSDSLMWGNRHGLLETLTAFARRNPQIILELKTKSANTAWLENNPVPGNILATWSLNPQTIIDAEEHLTASLAERLAAARRCADRGIAIGFHFHPIVHYDRWKEEYRELFKTIQRLFRPEEIVTVSFGTLTFIKPVIRQLRQRKLRSRILQMPMEEASGKLSYPFELKRELFSFAFNAFSPEWQRQVYFYLCMEDKELWEPVFGRTYRDNDAFEAEMKSHYRSKMAVIYKS